MTTEEVTLIEDSPLHDHGDCPCKAESLRESTSDEKDQTIDLCSEAIKDVPHSNLPLDRVLCRARSSLAAKNDLVKQLKDEIGPSGALSLFPSLLEDYNVIVDAVDTWLELFHVYGFDFHDHDREYLYRQIQKTVDDALVVSQIGNWMKYFKYKSAAFFSVWNKQVLPEEPSWMRFLPRKDPKVLFGGPFQRFVARLRYQGKYLGFTRIQSFSLSILMAKKGQPRPSDQDVRDAERETFLKLTTPKAPTPAKIFLEQPKVVEDFLSLIYETEGVNEQPSFIADQAFMEPEFRRTTREVFPKFELDLFSLSYYMLPSSSSNFNWTRGDAGTYTELEDTVHFQELRTKIDKIKFNHRMTKLTNYISEYYGEKGREDQAWCRLEESAREVIGCEVDDQEFLPCWRRFYWQMVGMAQWEQPSVQFLGLKEALKIRVISKGPPITYFVLKPIQRFLWKGLQQFWNFELTGTPISEELMNQRFGPSVQRGGVIGMNMFLSGDYRDTTNEIHAFVSETIADELCLIWDETYPALRLGSFFRPLFLRALTQHICYFPTTVMDRPGFEILPQATGQLMGSILSFPPLCIANAALVRKSYEIAHNCVIKLKKLPAWFNGDDFLLMYTNPYTPHVWRQLGKVVGLEESIGKTYDSATFCSINSNFFTLDDHCRWVRIPYVNMGLLTGAKRSAGAGQLVGKSPFELGPVHHELLDVAGTLVETRLHHLFMYKHMKTLKQFNGPWFLPNWACGSGLRPVFNQINEHDRKVVTLLTRTYGMGETRPPKMTGDKDWMHYDLFNELVKGDGLIKEYNYEKEHHNSYGDAFVGLSLAIWLEHGYLGLYNPHETEWQRETRRAEKLWTKHQKALLNTRDYVKPFPKEELTQEPKRSVLPVWMKSKTVTQGNDYDIKLGEPQRLFCQSAFPFDMSVYFRVQSPSDRKVGVVSRFRRL